MNYEDVIIGLFGQSSFLTVNRELARHIGLNAAVLYSSLLFKYRYYKEHDKLIIIDNKEFFFSTIEDVEKSATLSRKQQDKALSILVKEGFIEKKNIGLPAKRYFHIIFSPEINYKLQSFMQFSLSQKDNLVCPKGTIRLTQTNNKFGPKGQVKTTSKNNIIENNNKDVNASAVQFFIANYSDDYKLCQRIGVDPLVVSKYIDQYPPNIITGYLQFVENAIKNSRVNNPTGLFITAIKQGYNIQPRLNLDSVPKEIIEQTERDMQAQIESEWAATPSVSPESPFFKYYQHFTMDENAVKT